MVDASIVWIGLNHHLNELPLARVWKQYGNIEATESPEWPLSEFHMPISLEGNVVKLRRDRSGNGDVVLYAYRQLCQ
jgi:hypothetical protein